MSERERRRIRRQRAKEKHLEIVASGKKSASA
jgi:hypothetical protein